MKARDRLKATNSDSAFSSALTSSTVLLHLGLKGRAGASQQSADLVPASQDTGCPRGYALTQKLALTVRQILVGNAPASLLFECCAALFAVAVEIHCPAPLGWCLLACVCLHANGHLATMQASILGACMKKKDTTKAAGGKARAAALTPEERKLIAKKAAEERWGTNLPQSAFEGSFPLGEKEISCAVLDDGMRVITQATYLRALGRSRSPKAGTGVLSTVDNLPFF